MSAFDDFRAGERVIHRIDPDPDGDGGNGPGTVAHIGEYVHVIFDRKARSGKSFEGKYDRNWFSIYPNFLRHLP